jgi:cytochrome c-type biogenesis protein CcmF
VGTLGAIFYGFFYSQFFTRSDFTISDNLGEIYSILTVGVGIFTIAGIAQEYHRGIVARRDAYPESYLKGGLNMLLKNRRRYGGYLVHLSIVMIFLGYAGNAFKENTSFRFFYELVPSKSGDEIIYKSNDKAMIGNYTVEAKDLKLKPILNTEEAGASPNIYNVIVSEEAIYSVNRQLDENKSMVTERRFYPQVSHLTGEFEAHIPTSEPSIFSTPKEDFYVQLGAIENASLSKENPDLPLLFMQYYFGTRNITEKLEVLERFPKQVVANLEVWVNPLVKLIWFGSLLFFFSGLFVMLPLKTN